MQQPFPTAQAVTMKNYTEVNFSDAL